MLLHIMRCLSLLLLGEVYLVSASYIPRNNHTVETTSGIIIGHESSKAPGVSEYLGIPYAEPPTGDRRFEPPQHIHTPGATIHADKFGPSCPQNPTRIGRVANMTANAGRIVDQFVLANATESEDCLSLNIWAKISSKRQLKSVFVFMHGGRFQTGGSSSEFYRGQYLADREDIIVVSFNYRLEIFGYPGGPQATPNLGMRDFRMALEWIRENIESFGGDPEAVTVGGQSAGAMSMDYYVHSGKWASDPIVRGLIFESGQVSTLQPNSANQTAASWANVTHSVGCSDCKDVMACMKKVPVHKLLAAESKLAGLGQPAFQVTVDRDIIFTETEYEAKDKKGDFMKIPSLIGTNAYEPGFFRLEAASSPASRSIIYNQTIWEFVQLAVADCPAHFAATARSNQTSSPVWRYLYGGQWPNLELYPGSGAWHGSETAMVFGTAQDVTGVPNTREQKQVSDLIMKAWAAFVRDPAHGLRRQMSWPEYKGEGTKTLIALAKNDSVPVDFLDPMRYDEKCRLIGYQQKL